MNINDKFITSFFRVCVKLYNYDGNSDTPIFCKKNTLKVFSIITFINKSNYEVHFNYYLFNYN